MQLVKFAIPSPNQQDRRIYRLRYTNSKMGKPKKGKKFGHAAAPSKVALDEQISQGRVAKSKDKLKIRLRAEEEMVSGSTFKS